MQLFDLIRNKKVLAEGGNLALPGGHEAQQIDLKVHNRGYIVPILNNLINSINNAYSQQFQAPLWDPKLIKQRAFLSGSSLHFFNTDISDEEFVAKKPKVGDIDTQVNKDNEANLEQFLTANQNKVIGPAKLLGFQRGNEQFSSLWEFTDPPIKVQIDLEFVAYDKKGPTAWSQFSHSSSWDDLQAGIKGVFHKFLIQSFTTLTNQDFLLQKSVGRGANKTVQNVPMRDNMVSFAVSSKEGGGLRAKYAPVLDEKGRPLVIDGLPVMQALPPAGYEQDLSKIFSTIFDTRVNSAQLKKLMPKTWSFTGLIDVMNLVLDPEEKAQVVDGFINKLFAKGAQGLYKNDPDRDLAEKNAALNYMLKALGMQAPADLEQLRQTYRAGYKMTAEAMAENVDAPAFEAEDTATPDYKRQGIKHIYSPGSSTEMKDLEFVEMAKEIAQNNGTLDGMSVNLKADGAGIRFGKDESGKPFFMTSKVTEPKYIENYGDFEAYGRSQGQDEQRLAFTKNYDEALKTIVTSNFIKKLPNDTIVQAEMMYNPMAQETEQGLKFVNIPYDPAKLGKTMTLVPFMFKTYSTGQQHPQAEQIKKALLSSSSSNIKMVDNQLKQQGVDVSKIIDPVVNMDPQMLDALASRTRTNPLKDQAKEIITKARQELSNEIINNPKIAGKDQLGSNIEGLVINLPSGRLAKVTSQMMKDSMAAKRPKGVATAAPGNKTAVVAIGSFVGHRGHEELLNYTLSKAKQVGGDAYLFIGNAVGKDDPIPPAVKVQTWHKLYPEMADRISATMQGGSLMQKIKHELINPMPGQPPKYDNVIIMVGEDQAGMNIANALMKAVNKFAGYEHVKVTLEPTPRGTGMSFTKLRNILKDPNATPEQQYAVWAQGFDEQKLGKDWILHLMDVAKKGMGITSQPAAVAQPAPQPVPVAEQRLFNALVRPNPNRLDEDEQVRQLQQLLIKRGAKIAADGIMGPQTRAAMKQFGVGGTPTPATPTAPTKPTTPVAQKPLAPPKPGVEKKIAGVITGGPGYTDVKTTDGEVQRREGTRNWRNNNPGNIRKSSYANAKGAVGDDGAFAVFPTLEVGMNAKEDLVFGPKYINLSITDAMNRYAPPSENNTKNYIQQIVQATGASPDTPLAQLNNQQREAMLATITKQEGFKVGSIKVVPNVSESIVSELSNEKLGQYKKAAGAQASAADKAGDTKKADKRFSGIVKATKKQFANDEKGVTEKWSKKYKSSINCSNPKGFSQKAHCAGKNEGVAVEPDPKGYQKDLISTPKNSLVIDTPGDLDWYKLGQHYPTLGTDDPHEYGQGDSDMMIVPYSKQELADLKQKLDRLKMRYKEIGGGYEQPEIHDKVEEKMLPKSAFAGSDKNKLGPAAHLKGSMKRPAKAGDLVGGMEESKVVPVSEDVENLMGALIENLLKK